MKIAILSDIHGNAVALERVLEDIKRNQVDQIVVIGDLVFRGPEPKRTLELLYDLDAIVLKGNTDEWVTRGIVEHEVPSGDFTIMQQERQWTIDELSAADLDYLHKLQDEAWIYVSEELRIHAFHATPSDLFEVVPPDASTATFQEKIMQDPRADIYAYAHTHHPLVRYIAGKCVVNPGGAGYTFDGWPHASYALIEGTDSRYRVTIERVPYDVERVAELYVSKGYPNAELMQRVIREGIHPFLAKPVTG